MLKFIVLFMALLMASSGPAWAGQNPGVSPAPNATSKPKLTPIDVTAQTYEYYDTDNGWSLGTSVNYSYKGMPLTQGKDFEQVISPLNDPEANGLLSSAADKDGWGQGLLWGGIAVETAGWTDFTLEMLNMETTDAQGRVTDHVPNMVPSTLMILGGAGLVVKGLFNQIEATSDRHNAAARYNQVVQSDNSLSMMLQPDTKTVGLGFTQDF